MFRKIQFLKWVCKSKTLLLSMIWNIWKIYNEQENSGTLMLPVIYYSKFNSYFDHDLNKLLESFIPISKKISATQLCRVEQ